MDNIERFPDSLTTMDTYQLSNLLQEQLMMLKKELKEIIKLQYLNILMVNFSYCYPMFSEQRGG